MKLEITEREKDMLVKTLETFIPELRAEIASGVKHDWKVELKKEEDLLKGLLEKIKSSN